MASLLALSTLAVAQPLLDLLGRNAAFLVAHSATGMDVVGIALGLTVVVPVLLAVAVLALKRMHPAAAAVVHALLLGVLGALLVLVVMQLAGISGRLNGVFAVALAVVLGIGVPIAYRFSAGVRRFAVIAAVAAPLVAGMFVFASPAKALVFPAPPEEALVGLDDPPPIVMVIFDELPLASLLDPDGRIDGDAFPAFARLADDSTWFRNMTTVHGQSSDAIPAALTGRYPDPDKLPLAGDHPGNLFALLAGEYRMRVEEPLTQLCPAGRCTSTADEDKGRLSTLVADLGVVAAHLVLPPDLTAWLPPIDQGWKDFRREVATQGKEEAFRVRFRAVREGHPALPFERFIDGLRPAQEPTLDFLHILLPHSPWRYTEDGREYDRTTERPGLEYGRWVLDDWNVAQGYQRHLVQLQLADRLLGKMLDRLKAEGMYDESAVVVMADHGASFTPGQSLRVIGSENFPELAFVPFLIKPPGQSVGEISDRPVENIDVLPTILDVIGSEAPAGIDGVSAFDTDAPPRKVKRFFGPPEPLEYAPTLDSLWPIVERKHFIFGASSAVPFPFGMAPRSAGRLLGTPAPSDIEPVPGLTATIENPHLYANVDSDLPTVPAMVSGILTGEVEGRPAVGVAVNGTVLSLALTDFPEPDGRRFRALVPPESLRDGPNTIEVFLLDSQGALIPIAMDPPVGQGG